MLLNYGSGLDERGPDPTIRCFHGPQQRHEAMQVFDHIDARKLDQRDAELWTLSIAMILVLGVGVAVLMYPAAISNPVILTGAVVRKIFFGFCLLCLLLVGYLLERKIVVRQLRKQLEEERIRSSHLLSQASTSLLESLPGCDRFHDQLEVDFSRAAAFHQPLSLLIVCLEASRKASDAGESATVFVDAVKAMIRKLRGEDSIFLLAFGVLGILLPRLFGEEAERVARRLSEGLLDASGADNRFSFNLRLVNYPEHAATASEMEETARSYFAAAPPVNPF